MHMLINPVCRSLSRELSELAKFNLSAFQGLHKLGFRTAPPSTVPDQQ